MNDPLSHHPVVSPDAWLSARRELLAREKALTRARDELNAARLALPWRRVETVYRFADEAGEVELTDLFAGRSQLLVRHFMFGLDWEDACKGCSFGSDHMDGILPHLENHDVSYVTVSRAPLARLLAFRQRMGWRFRWVSSLGSDFNRDFGVTFSQAQIEAGEKRYNFGTVAPYCDELPGLSVFYRNASGQVFHTYSTYARGMEQFDGAYMLHDILPKGRAENGPHHNLMDWVQFRDSYATAAAPTEASEKNSAVSGSRASTR